MFEFTKVLFFTQKGEKTRILRTKSEVGSSTYSSKKTTNILITKHTITYSHTRVDTA